MARQARWISPLRPPGGSGFQVMLDGLTLSLLSTDWVATVSRL